MTQNLTDDERRDIEALVDTLRQEGGDASEDEPVSSVPQESDGKETALEETAEEEQSDADDTSTAPEEEVATEEPVHAVSHMNNEMVELLVLQNERLGILNRKVNVLTRLVELILRANLEEIE